MTVIIKPEDQVGNGVGFGGKWREVWVGGLSVSASDLCEWRSVMGVWLFCEKGDGWKWGCLTFGMNLCMGERLVCDIYFGFVGRVGGMEELCVFWEKCEIEKINEWMNELQNLWIQWLSSLSFIYD